MISLLFELFLAFFRIGLFGFGGGYAMLALMEFEIVQSRGWMISSEFLDIIAVAEMTPGPIAINAATFVGYRVAGPGGAALATTGVIFPSLLLVLPAAWLAVRFRNKKEMQHILKGLHPAVISLIVLAAIALGQSAVIDLKSCLIFGAGLLLLLFTRVHPLFLIALGAAAGLLFYL